MQSVLGDEGAPSCGDLLGRFVTSGDGAAFEALVRRHGPMVLGVCRRVLRNAADADDAFQATFLVLVRKAGSVRPRGRVGNWLYGVARTTALKAKVMAARRAERERVAAGRPAPEPAEARPEWADLLDQGLLALPDRYRAAIVLCDLRGRTIQQAARELGRPPGTVGTWLSRGRKRLAGYLARHGVTAPALAVATAVPAPLLAATARAAVTQSFAYPVVALAEMTLRAMLLTKFKVAGGAVLAGALALAGLVAGAARLASPAATVADAPPAAPPAPVARPVPPAGVPQGGEVRGPDDPKPRLPPGARGRLLAEFIEARRAQGLRGRALAAAVNAERARLGITDEVEVEDDPPGKN